MSDDDHLDIKEVSFVKDTQDMLRVELTKRNESDHVTSIHQKTIIEDYSPTDFGWRELFMKLCFEQVLHYFPQH